MPHPLEFSCPIMRRAAGFHADKAGLDLRKEPVHFRARQLALHGRRAFARQGVDLKIVLGEINANSDKFSHGRSPSLWRSSRPSFGTLMPLRRGRPHHQIGRVEEGSDCLAGQAEICCHERLSRNIALRIVMSLRATATRAMSFGLSLIHI